MTGRFAFVTDAGAERGRQGITSRTSARTMATSRTNFFSNRNTFGRKQINLGNCLLAVGTEGSRHTAQVVEATKWPSTKPAYGLLRR